MLELDVDKVRKCRRGWQSDTQGGQWLSVSRTHKINVLLWLLVLLGMAHNDYYLSQCLLVVPTCTLLCKYLL